MIKLQMKIIQIVLSVFTHNCNFICAMEMIILLGWYVSKALYVDEWASIIQMFYTLRAHLVWITERPLCSVYIY